MFKRGKGYEFCKKLLLFVEYIIIFVCILTLISTLKGNTEPLIALITGIFSLATISYGFYYWKAKNENIQKITKDIDPETFKKLLEVWDHFKEMHKEDN